MKSLSSKKHVKVVLFIFCGIALFVLSITSLIDKQNALNMFLKMGQIHEPDKAAIKVAEEKVIVEITPSFTYSYSFMHEGVFQHLDRDYTYDYVPEALRGGLLFQGIHAPPQGTSIEIELFEEATIYFFCHVTVDGGYSKFFADLPNWEICKDAPKYDMQNGDHGLKMNMFKLKAQPGLIKIPSTIKDRACFNFVFQFH